MALNACSYYHWLIVSGKMNSMNENHKERLKKLRVQRPLQLDRIKRLEEIIASNAADVETAKEIAEGIEKLKDRHYNYPFKVKAYDYFEEYARIRKEFVLKIRARLDRLSLSAPTVPITFEIVSRHLGLIERAETQAEIALEVAAGIRRFGAYWNKGGEPSCSKVLR